jgi:aryl-alcohol dehydrogenase-like predicted oxidoreductase
MAIEHKRLGKHGVLVSNICLGTMNFGWHTSHEESFKIMDRALELGMASGRRASDETLKEINENRSKLEQYKTLCRQLGEPPAAVALAWLLHNPIVTAPIIGPRTIEQLESTLRATEITLDEGTLKKLDEIFPGPGGEAPVAYSW